MYEAPAIVAIFCKNVVQVSLRWYNTITWYGLLLQIMLSAKHLSCIIIVYCVFTIKRKVKQVWCLEESANLIIVREKLKWGFSTEFWWCYFQIVDKWDNRSSASWKSIQQANGKDRSKEKMEVNVRQNQKSLATTSTCRHKLLTTIIAP